ncbi:MAG TPA: NADH-quinone oxidoreductase subunit M [Nitrososphaera sp.]|nr:NADH-quinone oxidoreductase subunit M [Nitrososphaera sp.]
MAESYFLLAAIFIPLLLAPLAYVIGRKRGARLATWFSFAALAVSTGLLLIPAIGIYTGQQTVYVEQYPWGQFGDFGLRLDGLSLPFALIIYILCTVIAVYSRPYMVHKVSEELPGHGNVEGGGVGGGGMGHGSTNPSGHSPHALPGKNVESSSQATVFDTQQYVNSQIGLYFALYLTFSMGMLGTVLATNLIQFYVFFELMLVPSFFLVAFYGYGARRRIALMFFFWTHVGAVVLLLGLLAMGFFAGGFDFDTIKANAGNIPTQWLPLIVFALVIGLGVKLAAFLLHIWLPYAHAEAPTPISALLSPAMIGIGAYGLLRLWMELLTGSYEQYSLYINMWGLATMIYGGAMALMQDDIKKVLAYSSISQMGYILFGLSSESILGITGGTMMYVTHGLGKAILFMMAGSIILQTGTRSMSKLGGLAGKMPYTAVLAMIGALTIIGIPPTSGFMAEWILFNGVLQTATAAMDPLRTIMFALGILATVLSSAYILWMYKRIFFGKIPEHLAHVKDSNRYITVTMAVFAAMTLIIGVYPDLFLNPIMDYYNNNMFQGQEGILLAPSHESGTATESGIASENMDTGQNTVGGEATASEGR